MLDIKFYKYKLYENIYFFFLLSAFFTGCKSYVTVFETESQNTSIESEYYIYENDSLRIGYTLWHNKGLMTIVIFNKNKKPLYIDWKKSSFISNSIKLDYWVDQVITNTVAYWDDFYYSEPPMEKGYAVSTGMGASKSKSVKIERITFIPPNANYHRSQFYIYPLSHYKMDAKSDLIIEKRNDNNNKNTKVFIASYSKNESPIVFRNFLTCSYSENFRDEFYIDNEFYVSRVLEMDKRHFIYYTKGEKTKSWVNTDWKGWKLVLPFQKPSSFYLLNPN